MNLNGHVVLNCRPGADKEPDEENFKYVECDMPSNLKPGEVKVENLYLSVDPAQRCQMNEDTGADYLAPWGIGETIEGLIGVGRVIESSNSKFNKGDLIQGNMKWPWKRYFNLNMDEQHGIYTKVDVAMCEQPSLCLAVLTGLTAIIGVHEVGKVKQGDVFVVSGAAGATGSLAGQIAQCDGATVVGICGSKQKCDWLTQDLKFAYAINYKEENVGQRLQELCDKGVDVYFDNVGGEISDAVITQMKDGSVVVLCGQISQYNKDVPYPPPLPQNTQETLKNRNISRDRYLVLHHKEQFPKYTKDFVELVTTGKIVYRESITKGLQNAGKAFVSMMRGGNIGKQIVQVQTSQ